MKTSYSSPELTRFGTVAALTAAIGQTGRNDQSEYPQAFPPNQGSYDVCDNRDEVGVC